ncbi:uncharacterized protein LOC120277696 [Dioscorea cayenensis subsp. rotundata]|uniref:Uncharacterized protein LOC120277696 n=1 Tax=Dioscorea cayennensis subsp. rotundata TaxID=55577 RepID=A0AB40CMA1_DIOCR|nr:uncharacterized protein LOC120277696 [Dioscorea cayenensis subsp. rotundata]
MAPYEALYGMRCGSPICWDDVGESQSRQKYFADNRRRSLEFQVGDYVFLRVAPTKGVIHFGVRGKLSSRFIGPFEILERIGEVAYRLALPPSLFRVHDVFYVSMLKKFILNPDHVIQFSDFELSIDLTYEERPIKIVDFKEQILRRRVIPYVKVQWSNHTESEATWELESEMGRNTRTYFILTGSNLPLA